MFHWHLDSCWLVARLIVYIFFAETELASFAVTKQVKVTVIGNKSAVIVAATEGRIEQLQTIEYILRVRTFKQM
jgi:hypothetical protein